MIKSIKNKKIILLVNCLIVIILIINFVFEQNKIENKFANKQEMVNYLTKNENQFNDFVDFFDKNENVMEISSKKSYLDYDVKQNKNNYYILYQNEISNEVLDSTNEISSNMKI